MLKFELTLEEANAILAALGKGTFDQVAALINKLQQQAQPQLPALEEAMATAAKANAVAEAADASAAA